MIQDWIKPGAPIAVYQDGRYGAQDLHQTTIRTVAAKSFTVEGIAVRFRLDTMTAKRSGSGVWSSVWVAVHPDSEEAAATADRDNRRRLRVNVWHYMGNQCDSLERVDQAIKALQEWRAVLASESGGAS